MREKGSGGANTKTGLVFEGRTDLAAFLGRQAGYRVDPDGRVFFRGDMVARIFKKHGLYRFLEERGVQWKEAVSRKLLPDDSIFVAARNAIYIIECKFQKVAGSVDEKLQTCDFKKRQYRKLFSGAGIEAEYVYLLDDWFKKPEYRDVLDYIAGVRCHYYFGHIPLDKLGLPAPG